MRIRLFFSALAYAVFLLATLLFPPFHDGLHHWYTWQPSEDQLFAMAPFWLTGDQFRESLPALLLPDRQRLVFEALIGLVSAMSLFLLLILVERWRSYRESDYCKARIPKSKLIHFLFDTD